MYRIELAPGEVTVFRTIDELATAVRNGVVNSRARIFHNASQKWLPIEFHPHYKLALELPAGGHIDVPTPKVEGPDFESVPTPIVRGGPIAPGADLPWLAVEEPMAEQPAPPPAPEPRMYLPSSGPESVTRTVAASAPAASPRPLPEPVASPVLDLPRISYPEFTPAEEPVAESRSEGARARRPLHLGGVVIALALGAYAARMAFSPARGEAAVAVAERPALSESVVTPAPASHAPVAAPKPVVSAHTPAPAAPKPAAAAPPAPPASSGFAPALEPRAIVSAPAPKPAAAVPAAGADSVAPAPVGVDLALPTLGGSESLVPAPRLRSDSAMKRILRAVSGVKEPAPQR
jgi:hypothetical protein